MAEYKNVNFVSRSRNGYVTIATEDRLGCGTGMTKKLKLKKLLDKFYSK